MKKRIMSVMLAVLMVISIVPAISLATFAGDDGSAKYRTDKTYEGYKDLWVSDGLYAYVDMTGINAENTGTNESHDANDVFIQGTDVNGANESKGHYFIRVADGEIKGNYLMLTTAHGGTIAPDANGVIKFSGYTVSSTAVQTPANIGVYLGAYYPAGSANGTVGGITRINGTSGYGQGVFGTQTDFYYPAKTADGDGYFGGFSFQGNAIMDMASILPITTDPDLGQRYKAYFLRSFYGSKDLGSIKIDRAIDKIILGTKHEHSEGKYLTVTVDMSKAQPIDTFYSVAYTSEAKANGTLNSTFTLNNNYTAVDDRGEFNTAVESAISDSTGTYTYSAPYLDSTVNTYSSFRIYDRVISGLEVNRNHFADLCYYYKLNIPESLSEWESSGKVKLSGIYNKFIDYKVGYAAADYATEIAEMQAVLDDAHARYIAPPRENIETVYQGYKSLYYDNGHLMSFVALGGLADADVVSQDSASFEDEIDSALLINGGVNPAKGFHGYHNFVKIIGGKNAGKYYVLGTSATGNIGVNNNGFVTYNENFQDDSNVGVFFGALFDKEALHYKFEGVNDLVKNNNAQTQEFLNQHVTYDSFFHPNSALQVDNTYGTYTIERTSHVFHSEYQAKFVESTSSDMNIHLYSYNGSGGIGTFRVHAGGTKIEEFGTADYHNKGAWKSLNLPGGSTIHYVYESFYINETQFENSIRILVNEDGTQTNNAKIIYAGGDVDTYDFNAVGASLAHTVECGKYTYYLRLYDCSLTDVQMLQNHFADLALHYKLDVTSLIPYGQAALTSSFLNNFVGFSLGAVNSTQISTMQNAIDKHVANLANTDINAAKAEVAQMYNTILASKNASQAAVADLQSVISGLNANKAELEEILDGLTGIEAAIDIVNDSIAQLEVMIANVQNGKADVDDLNAIVIAAEAAAKDANTAAQATSDVAVMFQNMNIVNESLPKAVENSDKAVLLAAQASQLADNAGTVVRYARAAKAKESMDMSAYIKFQGYQVRATDYASIRALFAINSTNVAAGYTFEGQTYRVAGIGYVFANATDDISDITVMLSGDKYICLAENSTVVMHDARYAVDADTKAETADSNLDIYGIDNSMLNVGVNEYKRAFTQDYMYRAFIVFEGEGTSFINYVDCVSQNLGESVSLYDAASYLKQNKPNEWYMDSLYWISKVIFYSEDN